MSLAEWLVAFRELHEKARRGALPGGDRAAYRAGREELARALVAAQRLVLRPGETARQVLRIARALQVDLDLATARQRAVTVDLSISGFSTLLDRGPPLGEELGLTLRLPASEPLVGRARVVGLKPSTGAVRVSAQFVGLSEADVERLELFVFDVVLAQLG